MHTRQQKAPSVWPAIAFLTLAYTLAAWIVLQIAEVSFEPLGLPEWALSLVVVLAIAGLPTVMFLAWRWMRRGQVDEAVANIQPRPWYRFWARVIDMTVFALPIGIVFDMAAP